MSKLQTVFMVDASDLPPELKDREDMTYETDFALKRDAAIRIYFDYLDHQWQKLLFAWVQSQHPTFTRKDLLYVWWS